MSTNLAIIENQNDLVIDHLKADAQATLSSLLPLAESGDADAQYELAKFYDEKSGIPEDPDLAWSWMLKAAEQGHALATAFLIFSDKVNTLTFFIEGMAIPEAPQKLPWRDRDVAIASTVPALKDLATKDNNIDAKFYLGWFTLFGLEDTGDSENSQAYFKDGANAGCPACMVSLGVLSSDKDQPTPLHWFEQSWGKHFPSAGIRLGQAYLNGEHGLAKSAETAFNYFMQSALLGSAEGARHVANCYALGVGVAQSEQSAFRWYLEGADRKDSEALYTLSFIEQTLHTIDAAADQKLAWLIEAVRLGSANAMAYYGLILVHGRGVDQDIERGLNLLKRGHKAGVGQASFTLAQLYRDGEHQPRNLRLAANLFQRSARRGYSWGHYHFGLACLFGHGIEQSAELAATHFEEAMQSGIIAAATGLGVADYALRRDAAEALGFILFGTRSIDRPIPQWTQETMDRLIGELDDQGMAAAEEVYATLRNRFRN